MTPPELDGVTDKDRCELEREEFRRAMENPRNAERVFAAQYAFWASRSANASSSANAATTRSGDG